MNNIQSKSAFGRKNASGGGRQSPLVQDVREQRRAARGSTSYAEAHWPLYVGVGVPGLIFGCIIALLIMTGAANPIIGTVILLFGLPFVFLGFLLISVAITRALSSFRSGAETIGNVTFLTSTNAGFKIGAAIGFGLFLYFTPSVFGDPFADNPSAKHAIIAQLILKALSFVGFFGMVCSRFENFARSQAGESELVTARAQTAPPSAPKVRPAPELPVGLKTMMANWPHRAATAICGLAFVGQVFEQLVFDQGHSASSLVGPAVFCVLAYVILRFYFKILSKVLGGVSGLYGVSIGAR